MNRWKMNRAGLLNFWYYDEETFDFVDGKLLLRGSNGSGKSVTMQSFLPVLLDGKKSPDRLDPFGSKARRMEDYLLGEKGVVDRDERTGYLFLEYKKENSDQYVTTGIGLQAKRHKEMKFWGFVITDNRRIGDSFQLYQIYQGEKIPLSAKELENRIGTGGQVVRGQKEYMDLVNKHIFGFQTLDAYDDLIKLLIQLRSPKLSKDFRPTVIYEILESALPPLGDDDLRHLSDTIENMDQSRQQLEQLEREYNAAKKLVNFYDLYNRYILAEKAENILKVEKGFKAVSRQKEETEARIDKLSEEIRLLQQDYEMYSDRLQVAKGEEERLNRHEVWRLQRELNELEEKLRILTSDFERKQKQLDDKKAQESSQKSKLNKIGQDIYESEKEEASHAEEMELDAREAGFFGHGQNFEDYRRNGKSGFDFTVWDREAQAHANLLEDIRNDYRNQEQYRKEMDAKYREASDLKQNIDKQRNEQSDLAKLFEEDRQNLEDAIFRWAANYPELQIGDERLRVISRSIGGLYEENNFDDVKAPIMDAIYAYQQELAAQIGTLKASLDAKLLEAAGYEEERNRWKNMNDPEPERAEATSRFRGRLMDEGRAFVPFYAAVDFKDSVSDEQKRRMEAALKHSGILDSLIISNPKDFENDRYIKPNPSMFGHTLADYLKPDLEEGHPVSKELVDDVLRTILIGEEPGIDTTSTISIDEQGFYRIGDLFGHAPDEGEPSFIGRSSRKRFQREKVAEFEKKASIAFEEVAELKSETERLQRLSEDAKRIKDSFPTDRDLREIHANLERYRTRIETLLANHDRVDSQYKFAAQEYHSLKQVIQEKTKLLNLQAGLESCESAIKYMNSYNRFLGKLQNLKIMLTGFYREKDLIDARLGELEEEIIEIAGERNNLEISARRTKAEIESVKTQLQLEGVDEVRKRIAEVQRELADCGKELNRIQGTLPARKENAKQEKEKLETLKREVSFWSALYESWKYAFSEELSRGFIVVEDPAPGTVFNLFQAELKKYDRAKMNELLSKAYYSEQSDLMEYRLTEYDQPLDLPEDLQFIDLNQTEQLQIDNWVQVNRRKNILMEYHGQKASPYYVFETLGGELETKQQLLDEQDRQLYEDIILKSVGSILRARINRANEWIRKMDKLMAGRNSSSGLTFSIAWKPKTAETEEEIDTQELVDLLQMNSKFLKEEDFSKITRHFQSKISKAKELIELRNEGNTLHQVLKEVLDYRKWFSFILSYRREGEPKRELTNNAFYKFSGGEKAMAMYIPLFTAAYSRYQEAAPSAPYIISLDEAFAGVDENNIRDMFQVVEELGFNYIMNSQALWGDYDTVKGLAISELVRPKNADYVTVIRYKWDGVKKILDVGEPVLQE
ncbi:TIGR02680 family protein [Bacillus sp. FJAT-27445]|uniref:TIGR02680 family protein n=1 Tax=Bacillus sp. FJAT-27445 TaxID=1679166 RepID=UPI0020A27073|nr:TIGR02680 family protein [Bacillus sp. FJAT-27445]